MQRIRPLSPGSLRQEAVGVHYSSRKEKVLGAVMAFVSGPLRPLSNTSEFQKLLIIAQNRNDNSGIGQNELSPRVRAFWAFSSLSFVHTARLFRLYHPVTGWARTSSREGKHGHMVLE